jgi:hypothetical protein
VAASPARAATSTSSQGPVVATTRRARMASMKAASSNGEVPVSVKT